MNCLHVPQIMMPKEGVDLEKWSVIACDQYTSEPEYWAAVEEKVGNAPSTLALTLPEVYLEQEGESQRIDKIHATMKQYVEDGTLKTLPKGFVLVERSYGKPQGRNGLVVEIDLETYSYKKGDNSLIRPTEMTVEERIPPRLRVRQTASLELPHIMLLIDDSEHKIIEPLIARKNSFEKLYDTDLMQQGGHITGYFIPEGQETTAIMEAIEELARPQVFRQKYHLDKEYPLLNMAVGDGNHSMATAKAAWETSKQNLTPEEQETHPARYCLCEIVNVQDSGLEIEPIHRLLFDVHKQELVDTMQAYYEERGCQCELRTVKPQEVEQAIESHLSQDQHCFALWSRDDVLLVQVKKPAWGITVATVQSFLDSYLTSHSESRIDYIHGGEAVKRLAAQENRVGVLLPPVQKEDLFIGVIKDGVLPRKTFSMGEANEKRYYMECKSLTQ